MAYLAHRFHQIVCASHANYTGPSLRTRTVLLPTEPW